MKYKIGDKVWWAHRKITEKWEMCPECFGLKYLTVILGDQSEVQIECEGCKRGYLSSLGRVSFLEHTAEPTIVEINKIEVKKDGVEYGTTECYSIDEEDLFPIGHRELADIRALELSVKHNEEESAKIKNKIKEHKSWSWHVTYHRGCIRRAQKDIEYHSKCLDYAKSVCKNVEESQ